MLKSMRSKVRYLILITWLLLVLSLLLKIRFLVLVIQLKKIDFNTKLTKIKKKITNHNHDKFITITEFKRLTTGNFASRLKQTNLASKSNSANFVSKTDFDNQVKKIASNKNELRDYQKILKKY